MLYKKHAIISEQMAEKSIKSFPHTKPTSYID